MNKIILIGNSPSSGSTLLADLFDSVPGFTCGPENRLFCYPELYSNFDQNKKRLQNKFAYSTPSLQNFRGTLNFNRIEKTYFLGKEEVLNMAKESSSFPEFAEKIRIEYLKKRELSSDQFFVDKYPENIFVAREFLNTFENSYFIHIIRNPLNVYNSLRKKGMSEQVAISTWILSALYAISMKDQNNFIDVKYSDLVQDPFTYMSTLALKLGNINCTSQEIEDNYSNNKYRKDFEARSETWSASFGEVINADKVEIPKSIKEEFNSFEKAYINHEYLDIYGLPHLTLKECMEHFNYSFDFRDEKNMANLSGGKSHLQMKYLLDFFFGDATLKQYKSYVKPIQFNP